MAWRHQYESSEIINVGESNQWPVENINEMAKTSIWRNESVSMSITS
jgi:hypothetical protein